MLVLPMICLLLAKFFELNDLVRSIEGLHDLFRLTAARQCASYKCRGKRFVIFKV